MDVIQLKFQQSGPDSCYCNEQQYALRTDFTWSLKLLVLETGFLPV